MLVPRDIDLPIIIVGAGIAGITCAKKLQEQGEKVILLEAKSTLGGRINSLQSDTHVFDLGASWIHGIQANPIWNIAEENDIKTNVFNYDKSQYFHKNGKLFSAKEIQEFEDYIVDIENRITQTQAVSALEAIQQIIANLDYSSHTFSVDYLKELLLNFFHRKANDPFATNLELLSVNYNDYEGYFEGDEVIFPAGYQQIVELLAKNLEIKTTVDVKKIIYENNSVKVIDRNNKFYLGSCVVITVPLGVLKSNTIEFHPPLPDQYTQSIQKLGFGSFNKAFFELAQPLSFRSTAALENISDFYWNEMGCFNILDLSKIYKKPVYLMLFGGKQSEFIDSATDSEVSKFIFSHLQKQFHNIPSKPQKIIVTRWGADIYSYGSFSFPSLQHTNEVVKVLHQPIEEKVFFAGEHCSLKYAGTVHGAYLNGDEIAAKILEIFAAQ